MKTTKTQTIFSMLLLCVCSYSQTSTEEKESEALRSKLKVKSITLMQSEYGYVKGEWVAKSANKVAKTIYNKKGGDIEEISYTQRGTIENWAVYEYDSKGNYSKMTFKKSDGTTAFVAKHRNVYDSIGRLKEIFIYQKDTVPANKIDYSYDSKGNMYKFRKYKPVYSFKGASDENGTYEGKFSLIESQGYKFDDKGRTIQTTFYADDFLNVDDGYTGKIDFKYDAKGKLAEKIGDYRYVYKYGANGLETEYTAYDNKDRPVVTVKYVYEFNQ